MSHGDTTLPRTRPLDESAEPGTTQQPWALARGPVDFEHQRVMTAAYRKLFGHESCGPTMIGRYRVEERIGVGGMGEVYRGFDPELERRVAIKLVLPHLEASTGPLRLRAEARSLARLSHPNVVQVYEVGEHGDRTFLAMELVSGGNLRRWLGRTRRPWRQVLERFVAAGRGLAAAHAAGVVHRDFKPDNVLLDEGGRVRVADFGLARSDTPPSTDDGEGSGSGGGSPPGTTRGVLGTLRYMPLEQLRHEPVDARADQFAFCVALYEALWHQPPFPDRGVAPRMLALEADAPNLPGRGDAPRALWRVIRRGLRRDPAARWPTMVALLDALEAVPRRRRRWALSGLAGAGAMALVVAWPSAPVLAPTTAVAPCDAPELRLDEVWGRDQAQRLREVFDATALPYADATAAAVSETLGRWSEGWERDRRALCEATTERRAPDRVLGLRGACLDRDRQAFEATVEVLLAADEATVTRAAELVAQLPRVEACLDDESLLLGVPRPAPSEAAAVESTRRGLARSQALRLAGKVSEAETVVVPMHEGSRALGYRPVLAEALAELGRVRLEQARTEEGLALLLEAVDLAEASRHDRFAADLWLDLTSRAVVQLRDAERGAAWIRRAEAASRRVGDTALRRARLARYRGGLAQLADDGPAAERALREALDELRASDDPMAPRVRAPVLDHLAQVVGAQGRGEEALTLHREALDEGERAFGRRHPDLAPIAFGLSQALRAQGHDDEAMTLLERAVALWQNQPQAPPADLGRAQLALAQAALADDRLDDAWIHARGAEETFALSLPATHVQQANASLAVAVVAHHRGDPRAAVSAFVRAAGRFAASVGEHHPGVALSQANAGASLLTLGELDEARGTLRAALSHEVAGPHEVVAHLGLASIDLAQGEPLAARVHLRALTGRDDLDDGDLNELALLGAVAELRLEGRAPLVPAPLLRALHDPDDPEHLSLSQTLRLVGATAAERAQLTTLDPETSP